MNRLVLFGKDSGFLRDKETGEVWVDAVFMYNTFGGRLMKWFALSTLDWDGSRWIPILVAAERLMLFPGADKDKFLEQAKAN